MTTRPDWLAGGPEGGAPLSGNDKKPFGHAIKRLLVTLVSVQLIVYGIIAWLSSSFDFYAAERGRPLLAVISLLLVNFALHLSSLAILKKFPDSGTLGCRIVLVALAMRVILIGSTPIQEVDIYRYIWDGIVINNGISPFRYPPLAIVDHDFPVPEPEAQTLRRLVSQDAGIRETLHRVHFPEILTVYPPASQLVFASAATVTPKNSSVATRLLIMKFWIVAFDVASLGLIWLLLRHFGKHSAWLVAWGWSPLVLKEFANSGHLDSIAVFFTLAATCALVMRPSRTRMWASGLLMGLAVASKLYPVVLLPLWIMAYSKLFGWIKGVQSSAVALLTSVAFLCPMFWDSEIVRPQPDDSVPTASSPKSLHGLTTFLSQWEMNDLLFMIVQENIRPIVHVPERPKLWFVVGSERLRHVTTTRLAIWSGQPEERIPFIATRTITAIAFSALLFWLAIRAWYAPHQLPELIFLALAWFWFLAPTQNPWYWCWALAFVPFANSRWWLAVSGLTMIYYLRFWFLYNVSDARVLGTEFRGTDYFDFLIVWLEFGPFLAILAINSLNKWRKTMPNYRNNLVRQVGFTRQPDVRPNSIQSSHTKTGGNRAVTNGSILSSGDSI